MKSIRHFVAALTAVALVVSSCTGLEAYYDRDTGYKNVLVIYSLGYNNLSNSLEGNLDEMFESDVPSKNDGNVLVVFSHRTARAYDYTTETEPVLYRVYRENGEIVRENLMTYKKGRDSASAEILAEVLGLVKDLFPASSYGMLFSSHGTGWLPVAYDIHPENVTTTFSPESGRGDRYTCEPVVKSAGMHVTVSGSEIEYHGIEIKDLASCIPMHLEYIVFDACLMGAVEVAYQLRNVCDYLVFSPTEVISRGYEYKTALHNLFTHDIHGIARDSFAKYSESSSSTMTMVSCSGMEDLALVCSGIVSRHRDGLSTINRKQTQAYFYNDKEWFYDLRDVMAGIGADASELEALDKALTESVIYKASTKSFFNLKLERVCGLSMYLPIPTSVKLNAFYKGLAWNEAVGLVN